MSIHNYPPGTTGLSLTSSVLHAGFAARPAVSSEASVTSAPTRITIHPEAKGIDPAPSASEASGFGDLLDIINPLQHIPIVSTIYRAITGDTASPVSNVVGGLLFGGPIGFAASVANEVIQQATGKDVVGNVMAALTGDSAPSPLQDKALAAQMQQQDAALAMLDIASPSLDVSKNEEDEKPYFLAAQVPAANAAAAYKNAQEAVLDIFEPQALAQMRNSGAH